MAHSWVSRVHAIARYEFENCRSWKDPREDCIVVKHVDPVAEEEVRVSVSNLSLHSFTDSNRDIAPGRAVGEDKRGNQESYW